MRKNLLYLALCFFMIACDSVKDNNGNGAVVINLDEIEKGKIELDEVEYIPLETTDFSLLGRIDKVLYQKDKFYVLDKKTGGVYVFDRKGKFLSSVCKQGEGPDEYIEMTDMDVDEEGNIYIADNAKMNIIKYSSPDWSFDKKYHIGEHFHEFCKQGESTFIIKDIFEATGLKFKLSSYDVHNQSLNPILKKSLTEVDELKILKCAKFNLYRSGKDVYYYERFTPNIYRVLKNGEIDNIYTISSEKYISEGDLKPMEMNPMVFLQERNHIKDIVSLYATDDYFVCLLFLAPSATFLFIPWNNPTEARTVNLMEYSSFTGTSGIEGVVEDKLLFIFNQLDEQVKMKDEKLQNIDEDSNPVLMLCRLKISTVQS